MGVVYVADVTAFAAEVPVSGSLETTIAARSALGLIATRSGDLEELPGT
ncbi:MAG: hypothetical protein R6V28_14905 [Nitriliruptoraceae bacterium]